MLRSLSIFIRPKKVHIIYSTDTDATYVQHIKTLKEVTTYTQTDCGSRCTQMLKLSYCEIAREI